jgi:molecular chaperone GrpE
VNALNKAGLEEIRAKGEPFDPAFHEAVSQVEDDQVEAGRVVQEIQKGYTLNKRLIRPAMVVVSKGKQRE